MSFSKTILKNIKGILPNSFCVRISSRIISFVSYVNTFTIVVLSWGENVCFIFRRIEVKFSFLKQNVMSYNEVGYTLNRVEIY